MKQSQPLRVEDPEVGWLGTTRCLYSKLWFVNNKGLEERILGYLAKYQEKYEIEIFGFTMQGNHYHLNAQFPKGNQSVFYRDFNARIAEALRAEVSNFPGGPFVERRYSAQALPLDMDIEDKVFYCALQAVSSGLAEKSSHYPGYNSFHNAVHGINKKHKVVDWAGYNAAKRNNKNISIADYTTYHTLKYSKVPGYEHLSDRDYQKQMYKKLEERRIRIVEAFKSKGHRFLTRKELESVKPGALPLNTKKSKRGDYRPLVLSLCSKAKSVYLEKYFSKYHQFKSACTRYLEGEYGVMFPVGTYRPPDFAALRI